MITKTQCKEWIAALRSGDYQQGKGQLIHGNQYGTRYCCLGVAKEIFQVPIRNQYLLSFDFLREARQRDLADRNDGQGDFCLDQQSFDEIADHIESDILPECK